jgi:hypothetical protein
MLKYISPTLMILSSAAMILTGSATTEAQTGYSNTAKPTPAQKLAPVLPAQPPVANTAPKPSPVGQPVQTSGNNMGYKPAAPKMNIKEPPAPGK